MKRVNGVLVALLLIAVGIIGSTLLPRYLADFSVMTKDATSIVELNDNFLGTNILVPEFVPFESDPYAYTSVQDYTLRRSRQKGKWDGYVVNITPTKLSSSLFHELTVAVQTTDIFADEELSWELRDITPYVGPTQNYPPGRYFKVMGTFQKGPVYYEVSGQLMGMVDADREAAAITELQFLIDNMDPVTSIVKGDSP